MDEGAVKNLKHFGMGCLLTWGVPSSLMELVATYRLHVFAFYEVAKSLKHSEMGFHELFCMGKAVKSCHGIYTHILTNSLGVLAMDCFRDLVKLPLCGLLCLYVHL